MDYAIIENIFKTYHGLGHGEKANRAVTGTELFFVMAAVMNEAGMSDEMPEKIERVMKVASAEAIEIVQTVAG